MWYKNKIYKQGFTLGELLVAIAVISVLSTIVLVSSGGSRERALNSKRLSLVEQYITAFEMYRQDNGSYPNASTTYCLGDEPDDVCGEDNSTSEDSVFNDSIRSYISGLPPLPDLTLINPTGSPAPTYWNGAEYSCIVNPGCKQYKIQWYTQGPSSQSCGVGVDDGSSVSDDTSCLYKSMMFN